MWALQHVASNWQAAFRASFSESIVLIDQLVLNKFEYFVLFNQLIRYIKFLSETVEISTLLDTKDKTRVESDQPEFS